MAEATLLDPIFKLVGTELSKYDGTWTNNLSEFICKADYAFLHWHPEKLPLILSQ